MLAAGFYEVHERGKLISGVLVIFWCAQFIKQVAASSTDRQQSSVKCNIKTICQTCVWVGCWMSNVVTQPSRQWKCRSVFSAAFRGNKKLISQNINIKTQVITHQLKWLTCYSVRLLCWSSDQTAVLSVKNPNKPCCYLMPHKFIVNKVSLQVSDTEC